MADVVISSLEHINYHFAAWMAPALKRYATADTVPTVPHRLVLRLFFHQLVYGLCF